MSNIDLGEHGNFLRHTIGVTNLFSWISQWRVLKSYEHGGIKKSIFNFDILMSQRFMLGFPLNKIKYGNYPFIAFQTAEYSWAKAIVWRKAVVCLKTKRLYLISQRVKTIYNDYAPSFAISIEFVKEEILETLQKYNWISLKHLWYEDELGGQEIDLNNFEDPFLSPLSADIVLPLSFIDEESELLNSDDVSATVSGNLDILDSLRSMLSLESKSSSLSNFKFIKGEKDVMLTDQQKEILKGLVQPLDYKKPKIRISVD